MSNPMERLLELSREIGHLGDIISLLNWDQETGGMPPDGAEARASQIALMQGRLHERLVSKELGDLVQQLWDKRATLSPENAANVREIRRSYLQETRLPAELVTEMAHTQALAHHAWIDARKKSDFAAFAPWLEKIFGLKKRQAEALGYPDGEPYNALLDLFESGVKVSQLNPLFEKLRSEQVPIVKAIQTAPRRPNESLLTRRVPADKQRAFAYQVALDMGFEEKGGVLAISAHPFCSGMGAGDVRITTRYNEVEPLSSFTGVMHETGHALYEQGVDRAQAGTPMGRTVSLGIHESQSRSWENMVGRSLPFWKHYFPKLQKAWAPVYDDVKLEDFHFAVNLVKPSMIRVEADEVTYNLHILVRYEIERDLFAGKLTVNDLPKAWNAKMQQYLGITPKNDAEGVLQDVHWSAGLIGYFPTYTLGNLYGAQLFDAARKAIPDLDERLARGDLRTLREWQREHIHKLGCLHEPADLVKAITGKAPDSGYYIGYLNDKFGPLYGIHGGVGAR